MAVLQYACLVLLLGVAYTDAACSAGWKSYMSSCYKFVNDVNRRWTKAKEYCENLSAHLVIVQDVDENNFVRSELQKFHPANRVQYWTDGTDLDHEGRWIWSSTGEQFEVTFWHAGEPNQNAGEEDCLTFFANFHLEWNDEHCDKAFPFVCEKELPSGPVVG